MRGDHVYVRRRTYSHHGIDCGDGTVIHYVGPRRSVRRIERTSWAEFAAGAEVHVRPYRTRLPADEIVRHAESRIGTEGYSLVTNNCEHFATWASTGSPGSSQVRRWAVAAPGAVASVGAVDAVGGHLMLLGSLGMGAYALTRPLRRSRRTADAA
ncbi:MAG TPA: lecithin retinol acyltransferase family protein [Nocardioides sp.]|nr:lecithin retinol acyltransferase family protein [Nocardioides sp.]